MILLRWVSEINSATTEAMQNTVILNAGPYFNEQQPRPQPLPVSNDGNTVILNGVVYSAQVCNPVY